MRMELEACWIETEGLFKCRDCIVHNMPEEYCPPTPLPIPPDYAHDLRKRSNMAIKGIWLPPMKMILKSCSTIGEGGDMTIPSPGRSPKHHLPGIELHDPLHGRQAYPKINSFHQGVGQICPR